MGSLGLVSTGGVSFGGIQGLMALLINRSENRMRSGRFSQVSPCVV